MSILAALPGVGSSASADDHGRQAMQYAEMLGEGARSLLSASPGLSTIAPST